MVAGYADDDAEARTVLASILDDQSLLARAVVDLASRSRRAAAGSDLSPTPERPTSRSKTGPRATGT